mgnify:CR=1 FL=1
MGDEKNSNISKAYPFVYIIFSTVSCVPHFWILLTPHPIALLPVAAVEKVLSGESVIAENLHQVSVIQLDIVEFSHLASYLKPKVHIVDILIQWDCHGTLNASNLSSVQLIEKINAQPEVWYIVM